MPHFPTPQTIGGFDIPGIDLQLPFRAQGADPTCPTIFRQGGAVARAVRSFEVMNPVTGRIVFYKNMGRPVLFSGDLAACKRVARVARRARSSRGRR